MVDAEEAVSAQARAAEGPPRPHRAGPRPASSWRAWERYSLLISLAAGLALWWLVVLVTGLPKFVLPTPGQVLARLVDYLPSGQLWLHFRVTLVEALLG